MSPKFEDAKAHAQSEKKTGRFIKRLEQDKAAELFKEGMLAVTEYVITYENGLLDYLQEFDRYSDDPLNALIVHAWDTCNDEDPDEAWHSIGFIKIIKQQNVLRLYIDSSNIGYEVDVFEYAKIINTSTCPDILELTDQITPNENVSKHEIFTIDDRSFMWTNAFRVTATDLLLMKYCPGFSEQNFLDALTSTSPDLKP